MTDRAAQDPGSSGRPQLGRALAAFLLGSSSRVIDTPASVSPASIRSWMFDAAVRLSLIVGFLALGPGIYKSLADGRRFLVFIYVSFYLGVVALALLRNRLAFRTRLYLGWLHYYVQIVMILVAFGLSGSGFALLIVLSLMTSFMLGIRMGLLSSAVGVLTLFVIGLGMTGGWIPFDTSVWLNSLSAASWFQALIIYIVASALVVLGPGLVIERLDSALADERAKAEALARGNEELLAEAEARRRAEQSRDALEQSLRQSQKMEAVGRLAGGVAHDFNNLLTTITGNISLARMDLSPHDPLSETLEEIQEASERAAGLTRQLLAFSRQQVLTPRPIDLNRLIRNLERMLRRLLGEHITLETRLGSDLGAVEADPGQIEQVLVNLAINARDAMAGGGRLQVETSRHLPGRGDEGEGLAPGGFLCVRVADTGEGMSEEVRERVFEPFFTTKGEGKGTGLGLATVYGIVRQHGGHVEVSSSPGGGSTFLVYLPRSERVADEAAEQVRTGHGPKGQGDILVVEDEPLVGQTVAKILRRMGFGVRLACSAEEALAIAGDHGVVVDLLMTDVVMPVMNGRELAEAMRALRPGLKVLYTSGYTDDIIAHHGVLEEGIHFLPKPYAPATLARAVREAMNDPGGETFRPRGRL